AWERPKSGREGRPVRFEQREASSRSVPAVLGQPPRAGLQRRCHVEVRRGADRAAQLVADCAHHADWPRKLVREPPGYKADETRRPGILPKHEGTIAGLAIRERPRLLERGSGQLSPPHVDGIELVGES